jgi:carbonic anhydrase
MVERHARLAVASPDGPLPHRPRAAILACSDARVPPSLLFGQEPGSLFVVRLAGNSATPGAIASLTYAVEALETDLVIVLGHTACGAVGAALDQVDADPLTHNLAPILTPIDEMLAGCDACDDTDTAVAVNVVHNIGRLRRDRGPLGDAIRNGRVIVRGAVHDLATGRLVDVTPDPVSPTHPVSPTDPLTQHFTRSSS